LSGITHWCVLEDAGAVAAAACTYLSRCAARAIAVRGRFRLVLAGGRTPEAAYRLLAASDQRWSAWEIWFGDERCLPPDHPERNSVMAARAWLDLVPIPRAQIHPIRAELGAGPAARDYAPGVRAAAPFDLVVLGLGEDGHTASLFPGRRPDPRAWVVPVHGAPKPPPDRVSLGPRALGAAHRILVLATGATKREAVLAWRQGRALPIALVTGGRPTLALLDRAADGVSG